MNNLAAEAVRERNSERLPEKGALFLFTIGPVQSFIAQARKAQDSYWSSFLLSHLCKSAIDMVVNKYGEKSIIFPDVTADQAENQKIPSFPNRFLALLSKSDKKEITELAKCLKKKIEGEVEAIANQAVEKNWWVSEDHKKAFFSQVSSFFQTYWVAVHWNNHAEMKDKLTPFFINNELAQSSGYALVHAMAEKALGARKQVRQFEQNEEVGRKCSLCGERNVLFYRKTANEQNSADQQLFEAKLFHPNCKVFSPSREISLKFLSPGEGLCGVCFLKRRAEKYFEKKQVDKHFPSIAEVALQPLILGLERNDQGKAFLEEYKNLFGEDYDAQLLYEENLTPEYFEKNGITANLEKAKKQRKKIKDEAKEIGLSFTKYYAVLALDGDEMGKWLAGEKGGDRQEVTAEYHKRISQALKHYSQTQAKTIVNQNKGTLLYAGGDDVQAFFPLEWLLDEMLHLRAAFSGQRTNGTVDFTKDVSLDDKSMGSQASASVGVCIAHYKTPLGMVIQRAHRMLDKAKDKGRDRYGVAVIKHSGEQIETVIPFKSNSDSKGTLAIFKELVEELHRAKKSPHEGITDKFIVVLRQEFDRLAGNEKKPIDEIWLKAELKRLISRHCQYKDKEKRKKILENFPQALFDLYISARDYENFVSLLEVALFLERNL